MIKFMTQIRDMDGRVWLAMTATAKLKRMTVAEYLTEILLAVPEIKENLKKIPKD